MRYLRLNDADGPLEPGLAEIWTEVDEDGHVTRELGINESGFVVHQFPSRYDRKGRYGLFDLAPIRVQQHSSALADSTDLTVILVEERPDGSTYVDRNEFELRWKEATREAPNRRPAGLWSRAAGRMRSIIRHD